ncbi:MAG: CYTH domain-containing protein [Kiritimatiellaceae bacterium]|nr:CYTH domain-containing protein [Kiritimatiellaceae bacterium]
MKQEIERKFLVTGYGWRKTAGDGLSCRQGYITSAPDGATVRVRLLGGKGFLTIKGATQGISRPELEYEIPVAEAEYMIQNLCGGRQIEKRRYTLRIDQVVWEIDEFSGPNAGLILAEIELESENQSFEKPEWLGEEVSHDHRYTNAALARCPIARW